MAAKDQDQAGDQTVVSSTPVEEVQYMPLRVFADTHALKYGIELMAGFYHEQERAQHYADTEANWHKQMDKFAGREVK